MGRIRSVMSHELPGGKQWAPSIIFEDGREISNGRRT